MTPFPQNWVDKAQSLTDDQLAAEIQSLMRTLADLPFKGRAALAVGSSTEKLVCTALDILIKEQTARTRR
jgi:hypothetical protein